MFVLSVGLAPTAIVVSPVLYIPDDFLPFTSRVPESVNLPLLEIPTFSAAPILPDLSLSPTPDNFIVPVLLPCVNLSTYIPILFLPCKDIVPSFNIFTILDAALPVAAIPRV